MSENYRIFNDLMEKHKDEMIENLQKTISYPSVSEPNSGEFPFGKNVHNCLLFVLNLAKNLGFRTCNEDHHVGWCEYGEGDEMIAVLGHLDVVPAGEGWSVPPFEGCVKDGKIYGRGAMDDKGPTIAALYSLLAIKESAVKINRRIRLFAIIWNKVEKFRSWDLLLMASIRLFMVKKDLS